MTYYDSTAPTGVDTEMFCDCNNEELNACIQESEKQKETLLKKLALRNATIDHLEKQRDAVIVTKNHYRAIIKKKDELYGDIKKICSDQEKELREKKIFILQLQIELQDLQRQQNNHWWKKVLTRIHGIFKIH